ncbi:MAG: MerR family transcriptional regulator [Myxococcales bacterium]|nr:MerR family transcriptional regulator [Myxococcales bacterium]
MGRPKKQYQIEDLEEAAGRTRQTIYAWRKAGLLPDWPEKAHERNRRVFSRAHVRRVKRIAALRASGYDLVAIKTHLDGPGEEADES